MNQREEWKETGRERARLRSRLMGARNQEQREAHRAAASQRSTAFAIDKLGRTTGPEVFRCSMDRNKERKGNKER